MVEAYQKYLTNYANFKGRSTRSDYWYVVLANFIIGFVLGFVGSILHIGNITNIISIIYSLATFVPGIAIVVRRLFYCMAIIPIVGWIIMLVLYTTVNENNNYRKKYKC